MSHRSTTPARRRASCSSWRTVGQDVVDGPDEPAADRAEPVEVAQERVGRLALASARRARVAQHEVQPVQVEDAGEAAGDELAEFRDPLRPDDGHRGDAGLQVPLVEQALERVHPRDRVIAQVIGSPG